MWIVRFLVNATSRAQDVAGKDRFQFTDKYGDGNYICRGCGPGDGFALLELCLGWKFTDALKAVEGIVGISFHESSRHPADLLPQRMRKLAKSIWQEAHPVAAGDAVATICAPRIVLAEYPKALRTHPALGFDVKEAGRTRAKRCVRYPAMVAAVRGPDGHAVTLHRTYLEQGTKAPIAEPEKLLNAGINGAAVRLFEPTDELAIAEGIETALAVHLRTGKPVRAALSATTWRRCGSLPPWRSLASMPTTMRATPVRQQPTRWPNASRASATDVVRARSPFTFLAMRTPIGRTCCSNGSRKRREVWARPSGHARFFVPFLNRR